MLILPDSMLLEFLCNLFQLLLQIREIKEEAVLSQAHAVNVKCWKNALRNTNKIPAISESVQQHCTATYSCKEIKDIRTCKEMKLSLVSSYYFLYGKHRINSR